jgi:hypothetical protein
MLAVLQMFYALVMNNARGAAFAAGRATIGHRLALCFCITFR